MNRTLSSSWRLAAVVGCMAIVSPAHTSTGAPAAAGKSAASASPWVSAASKHGGSGVRLRYSVPAQLQPGQPTTIELQFSGVTAEGASAELRGPQGSTLTLADGSPAGRVALPSGQVTTLSLRVVPSGDGLQTLDVFTAQADRRSAQSIPLKVGSGTKQLKPYGKLQTTPSGEKVISLPSSNP